MEKYNELQRVSYAQANALNVLGFNWETDAFYATKDVSEDFHSQIPKLRDGELISSGKAKWYSSDCSIPAPTVAHALMFMRKEKKILCGVIPFIDRIGEVDGTYCYGYCHYRGGEYTLHGERGFRYDKAESVMLDKCIEILLK